MLDKLMAAIGIGSAQVDTRLEADMVRAGETLRGQVHIKAGEVAQEIDGLTLDLVSEAIEEVNDNKVRVPHTWGRMSLTERLSVQPGESRVHDFTLEIPLLAPLSVGRQQPRTWVATRADIAMAIDPRDQDALRIQPAPLHENVFDAMAALGFHLTEAPLNRSRMNPQTGFVQEFEFKPERGGRFSHLDEAELAFLPSREGVLDLLVQRDTKARGFGSMFAEMTGTDEQLHRLTLRGNETRQTLQDALARILS
ncbi:MAG: sporulation protein [Halomonas sp.]|nr:sporulation protein [Halomonas sp.]